jgi:hypothetical protein
VFSMAYTDSGRLLPLTADGAGLNFLHIFAHVDPECVEECPG